MNARETYIEYLARCDQALRPYAPIDLPEFFAGRITHIRKLDAEISAPGRHVAIFGERGVGKTSLARLVYFFVRRAEEHTHFVRCQKSSTFDTVFADVLGDVGIEVVLNGMEAEGEHEGRVGIGPIGLSGARRVRRTYRKVVAGPEIRPRLLLEQLADRDDLVIIDEYDRVQDPATHIRMAEVIKQFSDAQSRSKIILVGVADTVSQLIGEHDSLSRALAQIKLDRMSEEELADIIANAERHLKVSFKTDVRRRVVRLADGFPYFVHLIGRHAARAAGEELQHNPSAKLSVGGIEYAIGLREALENAEHSLTEQYESAVVTTRRPSEKFALVLWAMALSDAPVLQVKEIAANMQFFTHEEVKPGSFNWNLGELVSAKRGSVLTKVREGYYKFSNPLMRPYVRSVMELENILFQDKQWEFPFMNRR